MVIAVCVVAVLAQVNAACAQGRTSPQMQTIWQHQFALAQNTVNQLGRATSLKQMEEIVIQTTAASRRNEQAAFSVWMSTRNYNDWLAWRATLYYTVSWSSLVDDIYTGRVYNIDTMFGDRFRTGMELVGELLDAAGLTWRPFW